MKNTPARNKAAAILRVYLEARREKNAPNFYDLPSFVRGGINEVLRDAARQFVTLRESLLTVERATYCVGSQTCEAIPVNPVDWFGKAWAIGMPLGNFSVCYIVEADSVSDALDEFSESKYGNLVRAEALPVDEHTDENMGYPEGTSFDGCGQPYDTSELMIDGQEGKALPFACKYYAEGLPAGGVSPVEYAARYDNRGMSNKIDSFKIF